MNEQILSLLGLARKARLLVVGQDELKQQLKSGGQWLVLTAEPFADNCLRMISPHLESGKVERRHFDQMDRSMLGACLGMRSVQVVALPLASGFAKKILSIYDGGSDANE